MNSNQQNLRVEFTADEQRQKEFSFSSGDPKEINRELIMRVRFCEMKRVNRREKGAGLHAVISLNYQEWFLNVIGGLRKSI